MTKFQITPGDFESISEIIKRMNRRFHVCEDGFGLGTDNPECMTDVPINWREWQILMRYIHANAVANKTQMMPQELVSLLSEAHKHLVKQFYKHPGTEKTGQAWARCLVCHCEWPVGEECHNMPCLVPAIALAAGSKT